MASLQHAAKALLGLNPMAVPPHVFAVDEDEIRYGRFVRQAGGFEFEDAQRTDLAPETFTPGPLGGPVRDTAGFAVAVARFIDTLGVPIAEASLVLPDRWLRVAFTEVEELPRAPAKRDEVLRWKLKHLVPFQVSDLRIDGVDVAPLRPRPEARRLMLGFGIDLLLSQLEEAFGQSGVRVGQVTNASLALVECLEEVLDEPGIGAVALVEPNGYCLVFTLDGVPVVHRYRALDSSSVGSDLDLLVARDLKLTSSFLERELPGAVLTRLLLLAPESVLQDWTARLGEGFGVPTLAVRREQLPLRGAILDQPVQLVAPMLGAACRKIV